MIKIRTESEFPEIYLQAFQRTGELRRVIHIAFEKVAGADKHVSLIRRKQGGYD